MTVEIKTEYFGQNRYQIVVRAFHTIAATCGTVARRRNQACEMWSKLADQVIADEIPDAWDMRTKGQGK